VKSSADAEHDLSFYVFTFAVGHFATRNKVDETSSPIRRTPMVHFDEIWDEATTQFCPAYETRPDCS
jgi:hypothetical protein